ncbi:MAG: hypothetical protein QOJ63_2605 [Solirubrobacteraceae bacterium]|jgi:hypothetical protein|nr:hypothetical protein [Solirubrobacteraceae bacterium]
MALATSLALAACGGDDEPRRSATAPPAAAPTMPGTIATSTSTTPVESGASTSARPTRRPGVRAGLVVGIGDQQWALFRQPPFRALGIRDARLVVAYDATRVGYEREIVDNWLREARRAGVRPFITFGHSREHPRRLPSAAEFRASFRAFRARYPQVRAYAPWNEINHASQPTSAAPARAAEYYNVVKAECGGCTVLAGDVLDQPGMTRYLAAYRRHLHGSPRVWGLHNYADANRFRTSGLRAMLRSVPGDVWLTETGGIVRFGRSFPTSERRAARAVDYALALAADTPRVRRIYLYNWTASKPTDRFDAGLVGPDGVPRPAYAALLGAMGG